jgi:hypothetical protein
MEGKGVGYLLIRVVRLFMPCVLAESSPEAMDVLGFWR